MGKLEILVGNVDKILGVWDHKYDPRVNIYNQNYCNALCQIYICSQLHIWDYEVIILPTKQGSMFLGCKKHIYPLFLRLNFLSISIDSFLDIFMPCIFVYLEETINSIGKMLQQLLLSFYVYLCWVQVFDILCDLTLSICHHMQLLHAYLHFTVV